MTINTDLFFCQTMTIKFGKFYFIKTKFLDKKHTEIWIGNIKIW